VLFHNHNNNKLLLLPACLLIALLFTQEKNLIILKTRTRRNENWEREGNGRERETPNEFFVDSCLYIFFKSCSLLYLVHILSRGVVNEFFRSLRLPEKLTPSIYYFIAFIHERQNLFFVKIEFLNKKQDFVGNFSRCQVS